MCEFAYGFSERRQFLEAYHGIVNRGMVISSVPDLYRARIRVGFGLWIDCGGAERWSSEWRDSLQMALELTDRYVWVYSHRVRFFPPGNLPDEYLQAFWDARTAAGMSGPRQ